MLIKILDNWHLLVYDGDVGVVRYHSRCQEVTCYGSRESC
jgi:hypothetical protein